MGADAARALLARGDPDPWTGAEHQGETEEAFAQRQAAVATESEHLFSQRLQRAPSITILESEAQRVARIAADRRRYPSCCTILIENGAVLDLLCGRYSVEAVAPLNDDRQYALKLPVKDANGLFYKFRSHGLILGATLKDLARTLVLFRHQAQRREQILQRWKRAAQAARDRVHLLSLKRKRAAEYAVAVTMDASRAKKAKFKVEQKLESKSEELDGAKEDLRDAQELNSHLVMSENSKMSIIDKLKGELLRRGVSKHEIDALVA